MPSDRDSLRGGRYVVVGTLGAGAQAKTLDAVDKREGRPVAIKRFDVSGARSWKDVELAEREARVLAALSHPMLPRYVEHFEEEGVLYLVMEKIEGEPLSRLRKKGPMSPVEVRRFLDDARTILGYLHRRTPPVIHRDLKPGNVLRRPDGSYAFVDFGAVRDRMRPEGGSTVVGTFGYMAPEQFQGRAGPQSDVYAVGATALALLTGREPEDLPHKGLAFDLGAALPNVDADLRAALASMLEPDPDRRATTVPTLGAPRAPAAPPREDPRARARAAKFAVKEAAREAKRLARDAKHRARDERRARKWARRPPGALPPPLVVLFSVGLVVAYVAVILAVQVVVPVVLSLLSIVFGPKLREAAEKVRAAGRRAAAAIERASNGLRQGPATNDASSRTRVEDDDRVRVNVDVDVNVSANEAERDAEAEAEAEEDRSRSRRAR